MPGQCKGEEERSDEGSSNKQHPLLLMLIHDISQLEGISALRI